MGHVERLGMGYRRTWAQAGLLLIDQAVVEELKMLTFQQMAWQANGECFQSSLHAMRIEYQHDPQTQLHDQAAVLSLPGTSPGTRVGVGWVEW